jgi:hypothetical protein
MIDPCAGRGCLTPLSDEEWHEDEHGGQHTRRPLTGVLDRLQHLERVFSAVYDLDRCCHGRHERDFCDGCQRDSDGAVSNNGNPRADEAVGYDISGRPITPRMLHHLASTPTRAVGEDTP